MLMKMISESLDNPPEQPAQFRGPVTALAFAQLENQRIILFGEGTHLQVRSANEGRVLARAVAFKTQVIHGISLSEAAADGKIPLIVWGGYVFRCAWLQSSDWSISFYDKQTWTMPGWILDVRFGPPQDRNTRGDKELRAAMVTAQDSLLLVPFPPPAGWPHHYRDDEGSATGSVLYSAHLRWMSNRHVVLATGTAFGDIAVRSFRLNQDDQGFTACSHRVFRGHEGSIFGVQTSDRLPPLGRGGPTMLLASCSDDRTIRVWDISEFSTTIATPLHLGKPAATASTGTGFGGEQSSAPDGDLEKPLAMAWGHLSRIWGTRFLTAFPRADLETSGVDLLSFGEDATMQHWRFSGRSRDSTLRTLGHDITFTLERQRTTSLHAGKNVWSIACSDLHKGRNTVAIGGADGKIACISLGEEEPTTGLNADMDSELPARYGTLQKYSLVSSNQLLAITGEGSVLLALLQPLSSPSQATTGCSDEPRQSLEWKEVAQINCPKPHVLIRPCREAGVTFFVTGEGAFYSLILETKVLQFLFSAATRPTNMLCQKSSEFIHVIISYDRVPVLHYWRLKISKDGRSIDHVPVQLIKPPADFLPTSMAMTVHDILLLGTRDGYVRACKLMQDRGRNYDDTIQLPVVLWSGSLDAVTSIICLSTDEQDQACIILTTTRDGKYAVYRICFKNVESESPPEFESLTLHAATSTVLSIIEGAYLANHQLILYGFRSTEFVVWNDTSQQMIMTVDCGGAHRNWDFCPLPGHASGGSLIWRKGPRLYRRTQSHTNHHIIQEGLHGREIKALAVSPPLEMEPGRREQLIATGAEDTSIRLLAVQESSGLEVKDRGRIFKCHAIMKKHTTGIQALRWSPCGRYLFSSGGYEEFFVWRVRPIPGFGIGVVQEAICPVLDEMPVVRITSFDVSQISNDQSADSVAPNTPVPSSFLISLSRSDSSIRTFVYDCSARSFSLVHVGVYTSCCLTQMSHLFLNNHLILCVAASDGYLALWDLAQGLRKRGISIRNGQLVTNPPYIATEPDQTTWCHRTKVHESAIMALESIRIDQHDILVATGGDDNAIGLTRVRYDHHAAQLVSCSTLRVNRAHACAITGIKYIHCDESSDTEIRYRIATAGIDQRVKTWDITLACNDTDMVKAQVRRAQNSHCAVADASDMDMMKLDGATGERLVVGGIGIEVRSLKGL